ncbi:MAG: hypothetical protein RLZZ393_1103 [Pseudomonadota bacterium]|jgi:uncharacterized membrane protein YecN with MAPEG domain
MSYVLLVVCLSLLQFMIFGMAVGYARHKYNCPAPATAGNEMFERYFRGQMNTLEQLVVFVPAVLLFASHVSETWAAGLGAVYLVGRTLYFLGYVRDPKSRGPGFLLTMVANSVLVAGTLVSAVRSLAG